MFTFFSWDSRVLMELLARKYPIERGTKVVFVPVLLL